MGKIAQASRHSISYVLEDEHGVTPENAQMKALRNKSCSLNLTRDSFLSEEKRQDRQITDVRTGTNQIGGDIGFEPSYGAFDDFLEAVLCGTWIDNELKAGVEERSFTIERAFNDIGEYTSYKGCYPNAFSLSLQPNAMASGTFSIIGMDAEVSETPLCENITPAPANPPYDSYKGSLLEGGGEIAVVTGIELKLDNGITPQFVVFRRSAPFVSYGRSNVTGTITAFFENANLIRKFLDETQTSLEFTLASKDVGGGSYTFILPNIRYTGADNPMDSDGPISISMPFQAILDECEGTNFIIRRNPPAAAEEPEPCTLSWSGTALSESADKPGQIEEKIIVTLSGGSGKKFAGSTGADLPGVSFDGVPRGLAAKMTRTGDTTAELSLSGIAAAHAAADSATMTVSLSARAYRQGFCHCAGDSVEGSEQTITIVFTDELEIVEPEPPADTEAPVLENSTPANGATDVAINTSLEFTFSELIKMGSGNITVSDGADDTRTIAIGDTAVSGKVLTAVLADELANGKEYEITMPAGIVADGAGNPFAGIAAGELKFTTVAAEEAPEPPADTEAPALASATPANGAADVPVNTAITLTFSESIVAGSGNITVSDGADDSREIDVASDQVVIADDTLTITLESDLAAGTEYSVTIPAGAVKDAAGNEFAGNADEPLKFTTASE